MQHLPHLEQTEAVGHDSTNIVLPGCASSSCVCEKVCKHNIASTITFPMVYEFIIVSKTVLTCFAFKSLNIVLAYYIINNLHYNYSLVDLPAL